MTTQLSRNIERLSGSLDDTKRSRKENPPENEGIGINEKYRHQDLSDQVWDTGPGLKVSTTEVCDPATYGQGGVEGPETDEVPVSVEASPVEIVGENVEEAAPRGKGPPLDAIPNGCEPAAVNIPLREVPHPNQGGPDTQGNIGTNEQDKIVALYSESFDLFG